MANSYDSALVAEILQDAAMTTLGPRLAPIDRFTTQFTTDAMKPRSKHNIPLVTGGPTVLVNPSSHQIGDSTVGGVEVQADKLVASFHATDAEMNTGYRVRNLLKKALQTLGNDIQDRTFTPITTANYGAEIVDKPEGSFSRDDLKTVFAEAKDFPERHLFLDGGAYSQVVPTNLDEFRLGQSGAFGFDSINLTTRWDGAAATAYGFVADSNALALVSGVPHYSDKMRSNFDNIEVVTLENGLAVTLVSWCDTDTREEWHSLEVMFGASAADTSALKIIGDTP